MPMASPDLPGAKDFFAGADSTADSTPEPVKDLPTAKTFFNEWGSNFAKLGGGLLAGTADFAAPIGTAIGGFDAMANHIKSFLGLEKEKDLHKVVDEMDK